MSSLRPQTVLQTSLVLATVGAALIVVWIAIGVLTDGGEETMRLRAGLEGDGIRFWIALRALDLGAALFFAAALLPAAAAIAARREERDPLEATGLPERLLREPLLVLGALLVIGSLWLPWFWYENEVHHSFSADAWVTFKYADWALAVGSGLAILLTAALRRTRGRLRLRMDRIANLFSGFFLAVLLGLVFRLIFRPYSDLDPLSDVGYHIHVIPNAGIALAVLGASLGLLASTRLAAGARTLVDMIWERTASLRMKRCPTCTEQVLASAKVCRHCGHRFDAPQPAPAGGAAGAGPAVAPKPPPVSKRKLGRRRRKQT